MSDLGASLRGSTPDASIMSNLVFSSALGICIVVCFFCIRPLFVDVYCPNILNKKRRKEMEIRNGKFGWIDTVRDMTDDELLPWVGVDGFVFIQTIKLIMGLIIACGIPAIFIMIPIYASGVREYNGQVFTKLSIFHISTAALYWCTLAFNFYVITVVFYGIYLFYRNLGMYRQVFLANPSACLSQVSVRRMSKLVGNVDRLRATLQLTTRTIILTNVSSKYTRDDLMDLFKQMKIDDVQSVVIIQNRSKIKKLLAKRLSMEAKLENITVQMYCCLIAHVSGVRGLTPEELESFYRTEPRLNVIERHSLMDKLLEGNVLGNFRPITKNNEKQDVDAIIHYYQQLAERDGELFAEATRFSEENEEYNMDGTEDGASVKSFSSYESGVEEDIASEGKPLVTLDQFARIKDNNRDYGLTLWGTSMSVVVIFGSARSSLIAQQCLLSARLFSMEVERAPTSDDIIWDNLYLPSADRAVRSMFGDLLYVLVNLLFTTVNVFLSPLLQIERFEEKFPLLGEFLSDHPALRSALKGILAPLFYNLFLWVAPYMLYGLSVYQGRTSKTRVQESLLEKYTWLLFIQSFIMFMLSQAFLVVLERILSGGWGGVVADVQQKLPESAAFFLNVIIQKAFISVLLNLLKLGKLSTNVLDRLIMGANYHLKTLRITSDRIMVGYYYPEYILFVFMIMMAFLPIIPIITFAGMVFYTFAYYVFRHHFIFNIEVPHESGGRYWFFMPTPILVGCFMGQVFCAIQFSFDGGTAQALFSIPLMVITLGSIFFLKGVFERRSLFSPLGSESMEKPTLLANRMITKQKETVRAMAEKMGEDLLDDSGDEENIISSPGDLDLLGERAYETVPYKFVRSPFMDKDKLSSEDVYFEPIDNPYCNPVVFKRSSELYVPPCFFHLVKEAIDLADSTTSVDKL